MSVDSRANTLTFAEAYNLDRSVRKPFVSLPKHSNRTVGDLSSELIACYRTPALPGD
jgi:hypothetical protein